MQRDLENVRPMARSPILLSREAQLLLLTASASPDTTALASLLSAGIDWAGLCDLAQRERAASIVWRQLQRLGSIEPPSARDGGLRQLATFSAARMLHLEHVLHEILATLAGRGIEALLLKGAGLAYTAYASFADRPMGDIDVLVLPDRAEEAWSLFRAQGWTWPSAQWPRERYSAHQHLPPLIQQSAGGARLEIHRDLLPGHGFRLATDAVWARARRVPANDRVVLVPHPVHQLLHVCVHFAWSHGMQWGTWRALRDVAAITQRDDFAWSEFIDLARESRAVTCCFWTLRLTQRLADTEIPEHVLAALRPPSPEFVLDRLEQHYVSNLFPSESSCPSVRLTNWLWEAGILPGRSGHGPARPWHVSERWMTEQERHDAASARRHIPWARLRNFRAWLRYVGRIVYPHTTSTHAGRSPSKSAVPLPGPYLTATVPHPTATQGSSHDLTRR